MGIQPVRSGSYTDALLTNKRNEAVESQAQSLQETLASWPAASGEAGDALREILSQYDVTDITPREFSEMLRKLHETGAISDSLFQELSAIRVDLENDGLDPDESMNLVEYYTEKLADRREADKGQSILSEDLPNAKVLAGRLEWMEKFALLHAGPAAKGLDTTA